MNEQSKKQKNTEIKYDKIKKTKSKFNKYQYTCP